MPFFGKFLSGNNNSYRILAFLNQREIQPQWILKKNRPLVNPELMGMQWV